MAPRTSPLLSFVVDEELLAMIDDYRYRRRFPTRAQAVKWLLAWALQQDPERNVPSGAKPRRKR